MSAVTPLRHLWNFFNNNVDGTLTEFGAIYKKIFINYYRGQISAVKKTIQVAKITHICCQTCIMEITATKAWSKHSPALAYRLLYLQFELS